MYYLSFRTKHVLLISFIVLNSINTYGQYKVNNADTIFNGNKISFAKTTIEKICYLTDPRIPPEHAVWREQRMNMVLPETINGEKIYFDDNILPKMKNGIAFPSFIFDNMRAVLSKLEDGDYKLLLSQVVISKNGKVAYYNTIVYSFGIWAQNDNITFKVRKEVRERLITLLNSIEMLPVTNRGKPVASVLLEPLMTTTIVVKDHQVSFL